MHNYTLLKIMVLYWYRRFHNIHGTFRVFYSGTLREISIFILRTDHWKVLWGTENGSSMTLMLKHPVGSFIFQVVKI